MTKLFDLIKGLIRSERGQDMVEYALITIVVSVAIILAALFVLEGAFTTWATDLAACIDGPAGCPLSPVP